MKRIYFAHDNLAALVEWLNTRPDGQCRVLIGGADPDTDIVVAILPLVVKKGQDLVQWLSAKMEAGDLDIRVLLLPIDDLPEGIELTD